MTTVDDLNDLAGRLHERIRRHGAIPFEQLVEAALYDAEGGFYATGGTAGRRGDFLTSPEVGPLFGAVLARALDSWWQELGAPDPFFVVDAGAGPGTLARTVLAAAPACAPALRYVLVERSAAQRARHADHLPLEPPDEAFAGIVRDDEVVAPLRRGVGPIAVSLAELPELMLQGVVVANELLDNLPFALCQRTERGWAEVWVTSDGDELVELLVPARGPVVEIVGALAGDAPVGARAPVLLGALSWLGDVLERIVVGRVVVLDYASTTAALATRPVEEWLRTYVGHQRGGAPLDRPGSQDITVEVALDQLARVRTPDSVTTQTAFLSAHGLTELVDEGRQVWDERAAVGDLAALRGRSRVREADALADLAGLGGFTVAEWSVGPPA